ncbi:DUF6124 family protein [Pseudomonas sp. bs2935]|uniref:DUF6124 family protein n=1 Tax=Pseudomonas sp. bs2935 TaxID=1761895 RepID=UPI001E431ADE|nr:DUF6124 family protein [Pseudomonas sp. bs2935]
MRLLGFYTALLFLWRVAHGPFGVPGCSLPVRQPCAIRHPICLAADGDGFLTKELVDEETHTHPPSTESVLFSVTPEADTETLLANASETLNSAREMASTLAFDLDGPQRSLVLAIHQLIEMGGLLVDRALEQIAPA